MKFDFPNEWMIPDTWYFWYLIFLRPVISVTWYFWDPIFLKPDISEIQYFWDPIFLRSVTWYFWDAIFLRLNISETRYFWCLIFLTIWDYFWSFCDFLMDIFGFLFLFWKHKIYSWSRSFEHFLLLFKLWCPPQKLG